MVSRTAYSIRLTLAGMNDVLPKPFTKEGLLNMLEKHVGHLKKMSDDLNMVPNTASTLAHTSSAQSLKDDNSSPGQSPSTLSTWHSPNQFSGISPSSTGPYMSQQQQVNAGPYALDQSNIQYQTTQIGAPPRGVNHRRQVSEMSGVDDIGNDPKRPRIFATTNAAMSHVRRGQPG